MLLIAKPVTPLFSSTCDFALRMPAMAADFLELETQIGRRFREDSVTDIIIASLLKVGGSDASVFTPPEVITGGDFDLLIYQPGTAQGVQYRIQSKRLVPHPTKWPLSSYRELDHPHGSGKQASTLIRSSAREKIPTIPLYAFYNPFSVCKESGNKIAGIQLADGQAISSIVRALVTARGMGKRPRWKRLEYLEKLFFPLSTILCPRSIDTTYSSSIIRPEESQKAVLAAIAERRNEQAYTDYSVLRLPAGPPADARLPARQSDAFSDKRPVSRSRPGQREVPLVVERAMKRKPDEPAIQHARIKRPKLILLSR